MNQSQRSYLIKKIKEAAQGRIKILEESVPEQPDVSNYLLHAVMSGKFNIKSNDEIKELIRQKALTAKKGKSWMGTDWYSSATDRLIFEVEDIFVIPEEYAAIKEAYHKKRKQVYDQMAEIKTQEDTLVTRITLASDKTLQRMINEVDDMGDLSLMDTKIKLLSQ